MEKTVIEFWIDMKVSEWCQIFHFWVNFSFNKTQWTDIVSVSLLCWVGVGGVVGVFSFPPLVIDMLVSDGPL